MKSPRQHYVEAERLVDLANAPGQMDREGLLVEAQVHATLSTADPGRIPPEPVVHADRGDTTIQTPTLVGESL